MCQLIPETGIEVHTYGSHIFHTHLPEVWEFVNGFVDFNGYQHKVLASYRGKTYHLPLGLTLINKFFGIELKPSEVAAFMADEKHSAAIFDAFFRGYTCKQWGMYPEQIDPSVIKRVPVRSNYDTNYFNDYNQGIPLTGYNSLFDHILDHPNITVRCNHSVKIGRIGGDEEKIVVYDEANKTSQPLSRSTSNFKLYYSGPIDELFDYRHGALPWRTLHFERETLPISDFQGTSVVNYPDIDVPYTRIHEFKHYHPEGKLSGSWGFNASKTIIMRECSATWHPGDEPYYPINTPESTALLAKYQEEVDHLNQRQTSNTQQLIVGGRLGGYKYYDMDKSIEAALKVEI